MEKKLKFRDMIRFRNRHIEVPIDEPADSLAAPQQKETLKELMELPVRQKAVICLHYMKGYHIKEIRMERNMNINGTLYIAWVFCTLTSQIS